jgi:Protein of unknown function (DUF3551)
MMDFAVVFLQIERRAVSLERFMKTIYKFVPASAIAFSTFALLTMSGSAAYAGPIVPPGHYCMTYDHGGSDCSFTSYAQCLASASGIDAECFGKTARDDSDDQQRGRSGYEARAQSY